MTALLKLIGLLTHYISNNFYNLILFLLGRFITKSDTPSESAIRNRVSNHLQKCINGLEQVAHFPVPSVPFMSGSALFNSNPNGSELTGNGDQNNNPKIQLPQGIQLIPSR